ncbi:hypothetical protein BDV06DRAFT_178077 [Aspergillus oleicola]
MAARFRRALYILTPPALGVWAIDRKLSALEAKYPALPVDDSTCSAALRTPSNPGVKHTPHIDIYSARVRYRDWIPHEWLDPQMLKFVDDPLFQLMMNAAHLQEWPTVFFSSRLMRLEGSIIGYFSGCGFQPGDRGDSKQGFNPIFDPARMLSGQNNRRLLNGALTVERPPTDFDPYQPYDWNPYGLLVSWKMPNGPRLFFEKIARWGYPWRLMSGGRHEFTVEGPYYIPGRDDEGLFFEFRFASAHDYQIVPEEGDLSRQKTIPKWTARLHRGYARLLLDRAVKENIGLSRLTVDAFGSERPKLDKDDYEDDHEVGHGVVYEVDNEEDDDD